MLTQLFFTNLHFTIKVLAALVFFTTGWVHFSSWKIEKKGKTLLLRSLGFFLLSLVAIIQATLIDSPSLLLCLQITKTFGLTAILISIIKEPILTPPKAATAIFILISQSLVPLSTALYFLIAAVYLRKSTEGSEKQNLPMFFVFLFLSLSEFINIFFFASGTSTVFWSKLLADFGLAWQVSRIVELIGIIIMGIWTWGYIRFRAQVQLFIIFVTSSFLIFTLATFSFTRLLLNNIEKNTLTHLETDVKVLQYGINRLESEAIANSRAVGGNPAIKDAIAADDSEKLYETMFEFMLAQNTSFLEATDRTGKVIMRAGDKESVGDSLSDDVVVISALEGKPLSTIIVNEGIAPEVQIRASAPIYEEGQVTGVIVTGFSIDSAFVDGVKNVTGLDATVFAGDTRAATTFVSPDEKSRFIGTKESNNEVLSTVLERGEVFTGRAQVLNRPFFTSYSPLISKEGKIVGMLFVGKPQTELFETAEKSIELTLLGSVVLMVLSIVPAYFAARYIEENIKA